MKCRCPKDHPEFDFGGTLELETSEIQDVSKVDSKDELDLPPEILEDLPPFEERELEKKSSDETPVFDLGNLKYVAIVRHGDYSSSSSYGGVLLDNGKEQMRYLAEQFRERVFGHERRETKIQVITSSAIRALLSAAVFCRKAGVDWSLTQFEPYLWTGCSAPAENYEHDEDTKKTRFFDMITRNNDKGALVFFSHLEFCCSAPGMFLKKTLDLPDEVRETPNGQKVWLGELEKGTMFLYDVQNQRYELLRLEQ